MLVDAGVEREDAVRDGRDRMPNDGLGRPVFTTYDILYGVAIIQPGHIVLTADPAEGWAEPDAFRRARNRVLDWLAPAEQRAGEEPV